jgi:asparagine synthase (glutamine-hydrolysing)
MSAIAGIFSFNSTYISEDQTEKLLMMWKRLEAYGPDDGDVLIKGPIAMCYRALHVNRESRLEKQPYVASDGRVIVGDLRLDNREELIAILGEFLDRKSCVVTDIELALAAYQRWGKGFPLYLIGEFALMLYDPIDNKVLLARDHMGSRSLFYHIDKDRLICSSELGTLLATADVPLQINDEFIAEYIVYNPRQELTPYRNIYGVKPFHLISITAEGKMREEIYWDLSEVKEIRYKKDEDYEDEFNYLFNKAVSGPLRTDRPIFSELSGGIDSSAVVCIADRLIRNGDVQAPALFTISHVFDESSSSDERKYISYVEEKIGRTSYHLNESDAALFSKLTFDKFTPILTSMLYCTNLLRVTNELMSQIGASVILSGGGGDEMTCSYSNPSPELADLLVGIRPMKLYQRIKAWSKATKKPYLMTLWESVIMPFLPSCIRANYRARNGSVFPSFFNRDFAEKWLLKEILTTPVDPFHCRSFKAKDQSIGFWTAVKAAEACKLPEFDKSLKSYPFLYRPLVEFVTAIPRDQLVRPGETRSLLRRSMKNTLPLRVCKRRSKGNPHEGISRALVREWDYLQSLLVDTRVSAYGYVDRDALQRTMDAYRYGNGLYSVQLVKTLVLEAWLRAFEKTSVSILANTFVATKEALSTEVAKLRAVSKGM